MINLGTFRPGSTIYIPFDTFAGSTGASITMTGLAVTDIEVYKNGSVTQRASDTGYTLLDTDGIDFDALTGIHGFSIDLSSNADAGFYVAGGCYFVVVSAITVDSQTVSFVAAWFSIGYPDAIINTTIAALTTQTSFTLTAGPAEDNALNGCIVVIHDIASAVQMGFGIISAYTGSTKTVTLIAGTTFTAAAGDNISVFPPRLLSTVAGRTLDVSAGGEAGMDWANIGSPTTAQNLSATNIDVDQVVASVSGAVGSVGAGGITAASIATGAVDADALATDAVAEIQAGLATPTNITAGVITTVTNLTNAPTAGDLTAAMKTSVKGEVVNALNVDTYTEPGQEAPPATTTLVKKLGYLYKFLRNRKTQTATTLSVFADDATTVDQKATISDNGTTYDHGEVATGP